MSVVCVATTDGRAYYTILSRLRRTHLNFVSATPAEARKKNLGVVITTKKELGKFEGVVFAIEDLDEDPLIMKGQILAKIIDKDKHELLMGVDPGSRTGLAVFYGEVKLASLTFNSVSELLKTIQRIARSISSPRVRVKIGDGEPRLSKYLADAISNELRGVIVEIVDEKGTSVSNSKDKGITRDQSAAARIAFRSGVVYEKKS